MAIIKPIEGKTPQWRKLFYRRGCRANRQLLLGDDSAATGTVQDYALKWMP